MPSGSSGIQMSALELGKSWGIALVLIMKYLLKKPSKIFFLRINAKCLKNNLCLEQLANLYAYNLKKSQSLIGHFLLRLTKLVRKY